jgi:hypothetical protein
MFFAVKVENIFGPKLWEKVVYLIILIIDPQSVGCLLCVCTQEGGGTFLVSSPVLTYVPKYVNRQQQNTLSSKEKKCFFKCHKSKLHT